jgi:hypothetical protein
VDVARPEFRREAVTLWGEDEERVIADRLEMAVVRPRPDQRWTTEIPQTLLLAAVALTSP